MSESIQQTSDRTASGDELIRGSLGAWEIAFFTIAAAGPLLVVAGFAPLAFMIGGVGAVGAQLIAGVVLLLFAVGLTRMAVRIRNSGAFYAYIGRGLGKPVGGGAAVLALVAYSVIATGQLGAVGAFAVGPMKEITGLDVPWPVWSFGALFIVAFLGHRKVSLSAKVLGVALLSEASILLVLAVAVLVRGGPEGIDLSGFEPNSIFAGAGSGAMFAIVFGAFIGFESTAIYSEEARDPARTLPRAVYLAVGFLAIFYTFMAWVIVVAYGKSEIASAATKDPVGLVFAAMEKYVGHPAVVVTEILLVSSAFASVLAFHNTATRYIFALGRERLLPKRLAQVHPVHGSPYVASRVQAIFAFCVIFIFMLIGADPYLEVFLLMVAPGVLAVVVLQALCSVAIVVFFNHHEKQHGLTHWSTTVAPAFSFLALSVASWLIATNFEYFSNRTGAMNWILLSVLPISFAAGVARTLYMRKNQPEQYEQLTQTQVY